MAEPPRTRPARPGDAERVAKLLYESSGEIYDRYAGGAERALRILVAAFERGGNTASCDVVFLAEVDGSPAAVIAAFPVAEARRRAQRFLRLSLARLPPTRWSAALRLFRIGAGAAPPPPPDALYVDALATGREYRRRGAARALLAAAEHRARELELPAVALDTELTNEPARSLYEGSGFIATGQRPPAHGLPGYVGYVRRLGKD